MNDVLSIKMVDGNKEINLYEISDAELRNMRSSIVYQMSKASFTKVDSKADLEKLDSLNKELHKQLSRCVFVMVERGIQ